MIKQSGIYFVMTEPIENLDQITEWIQTKKFFANSNKGIEAAVNISQQLILLIIDIVKTHPWLKFNKDISFENISQLKEKELLHSRTTNELITRKFKIEIPQKKSTIEFSIASKQINKCEAKAYIYYSCICNGNYCG